MSSSDEISGSQSLDKIVYNFRFLNMVLLPCPHYEGESTFSCMNHNGCRYKGEGNEYGHNDCNLFPEFIKNIYGVTIKVGRRIKRSMNGNKSVRISL